ncbi:MAG: 6-phosphogluconolactonase [Pararhodobacter sp.]
MTMTLHEYPDADMLALALAKRLAADLRAALERRERALFVVPGGNSPGPVFDMLAAASLDWGRVDLVLSDERWVPRDHPRSNSALVNRRLMRGKPAAARMIPLHLDAPVPDAAVVAQLARGLAPALPVDVALLGMGGDGHTASLFPGAPELAAALATDAPPVLATNPPGQPEPRVTLTAPVLGGAFVTHILITGPEKRKALEAARNADPMLHPVAAFLGTAQVHWAP